MGDKVIKKPIQDPYVYKDDSFNRLSKLQLLVKKESYLKDLCKIIFQ